MQLLKFGITHVLGCEAGDGMVKAEFTGIKCLGNDSGGQNKDLMRRRRPILQQ
jgi:hypothetical protein